VTVTGGGVTWTTITFDQFETNFGSYTDGGTDCVRYTGGTFSYQGVASIDVQDNTTTSNFSTTTARNVSTYQTQQITFFFRAQSMEAGEDFFVEYFNGTAYQVVGTYVSGTSFTNGSFFTSTITLNAGTVAFPTNARIRFRCDASNDNDDVYIDNITWRATPTPNASSEGMTVTMVKSGLTPIEPTSQPVFETSLAQNYPNPFNPRTTIAYTLAKEGHANLEIFDAAGHRVATLVDGVVGAGKHTVDFDASSLSSGIYFYRLAAEGVVQQKKMVLLK
jgi:bacillolysin